MRLRLAALPIAIAFGLIFAAALASPTAATFPSGIQTATWTSSSATTAQKAVMPSDVATGDLLLVFWANGGTSLGTVDTKWTTLSNAQDNGTGDRTAVFYAVADGSEAGQTLALSTLSTANNGTSITYRIRNYSGLPMAASATGASSANPNPPSLNPGWTQGDTLWLAAAANGINTSTTSYPSSYTSGTTQSVGSTGAATLAVAQRNLNAASTDPGAYTMATAATWAAFTVAVREQPVVDFTTPNEGTTVLQSSTSYSVAWTEKGNVTSRSLQRQAGAVVTAGSCADASFADDGN